MSIVKREIVKQFQFQGEFQGAEPLTVGHIHDTYVVTTQDGDKEYSYVIQRINNTVFQDVERLMANMDRVTSHVCSEIDQTGEEGEVGLELVYCTSGASYCRDPEGGYWRAFKFIDNAKSYMVCDSPEKAFKAASACGRFQKHLDGLNVDDFHEVIPGFTDFNLRLRLFEEAKNGDQVGRLGEVAPEIEFVEKRVDTIKAYQGKIESGLIPRRVVHNDLKYNNVMFDLDSGDAVSVLDLDTVMGGTVLYDFGDLVRNTSVAADEDETDLSKVFIDLDYFEKIVEGYLGPLWKGLNEEEKGLIPIAPSMVTLVLGIRFLTDHLNGDKYFKVHHEGHNLERTRSQFRLVETMEESSGKMEAIIANLYPQLHLIA